jgi:AmmeMemoRadiSam system protein B
MRRKAAVAGYFYPKNPAELRRMIGEMVGGGMIKEKALAVISPHAGYIYSGGVAGAAFSSIELPDKFVIIGPSHRPIQSVFAIMKDGEWETPLGTVPIASELAGAILKGSDLVRVDAPAHAEEHSVEVQLPIIQYFKPACSFVPLSVSYEATYDDLEALGEAVASAVIAAASDVLIVASSDMSHYVTAAEAKEKDFMAIHKVLELDARGLYETVKSEDISMCGFQPATAALVAAKALGAKTAELVKYGNSGEHSGNFREVVGYAGLRIL